MIVSGAFQTIQIVFEARTGKNWVLRITANMSDHVRITAKHTAIMIGLSPRDVNSKRYPRVGSEIAVSEGVVPYLGRVKFRGA